MPNEAPYKIKKDGSQFKVVNNAGMTKATFKTRDAAVQYLRALYANVPGAAKKADKTKWTGNAPKPTKSEAAAKPITMSDGKFPISNQSDANDAWKLRNSSKNHSEDEVKAHISRAVKKLGLKHPAETQKSRVMSRLFALDEETLARLRASYFQGEQAKEKPAKGKHHFVHQEKLGIKPGTAGWYGPGMCAACGQPKNDPDHDGDVDAPGGSDTDADTQSAAIHPKPSPAADAETEVIKQNRLKPQAKLPHPFQKSTKPIDGAHRCLMCGKTQPDNNSGLCNSPIDIDGSRTPQMPMRRPSIPVMAKLDDQDDAAKAAQGVDAGIDQAIVLLNSASNLPEEGQQALQLLQGIEETADNLLDWFGVGDADVDDQDAKQVKAAERAFSGITSLTERTPPPALAKPGWAPNHPAFVTELNGKTLVTAQATVDPALFEKAFTPNEYFLWTQGRLVGADEANRNGAFWTSGDLELGQATVKHGPLNWLHDGKHVIGTLAEAAFTTPTKEQADDGFSQPHIAVVGPVWRWIYPDEAEVIQMASEANKFWYSMECVSRTVQCVGDGGCGAEAAYLDYIQGKGNSCQHMVERSATRRFADPTFLGAAVIVPPVRPGWADANAGVMQKAAQLAEKSYEQAGRPDMPASEWEQLMAQVLRYSAMR